MKKAQHILCSIINAFIISGIIIFIVGVYYLMIKAGIPYQDPPLDLLIQYEINAGIGNLLIGIGFKITILSSIIRFALSLTLKAVSSNLF